MDHAKEKDARARLSDGLSGNGAHLSLEDAVADFPESLMNSRPPHVPYSFWHQLEHIRIAQQDLLLYAASPGHRSPVWPDGYWPETTHQADPAEWNATIASIQRDRGRFVDLVNDPQCDIFAPQPHMDGRSVFRAAMLAIDHTAYHLGEFVMGRQILGSWKSELDR